MAAVAIAHRGDPYRVRENTLPSLRSALDRGADAVEVDVRLTRDGRPVLLHDATLERLWGYDRPLADFTAREVRELTGGGVPQLREGLAQIQATPAARAFIDLPDPSAVPTTVAEVRDCGAAERTYYCGGANAMLAVRAQDRDAEIALTWTTLAPPRPSLLAAIRPRWLNYRFGLLSADLVDRVHADGLLVAAWTADTRRTMTRLLRLGVDSVTTNRIDILRKVIDVSDSSRAPGT
ncbi:glycerophosphodiester phosphodiesterase [Streptomyces sp. 8N706]|uniref:glycerophosphodiester phosphodiesterase n=1 Tax=Streptomyces sp. 8N706 TaxID=3457416 RepID=UPI003FD20EED